MSETLDIKTLTGRLTDMNAGSTLQTRVRVEFQHLVIRGTGGVEARSYEPVRVVDLPDGHYRFKSDDGRFNREFAMREGHYIQAGT